MIQLISGNIPFLLKDELLRWKKGFISKYSDIGVSHVVGSDFHLQSIRDTLYSRSFFSDKKLLIFEDFPLNYEFIDELFLALEGKNDETIVLITVVNPDKRLLGYKSLLKIASEHKDYSISDDSSALSFLHTQYSENFEPGALEYLYQYKGNKLEKTVSEIIKLLETYDFISKDTIRQFIIPELDSSIFRLIDLLLQKNSKSFFTELELLLVNESFYLISQSLLSNLRNNIYIEYLKPRMTSHQVGDILSLGRKSFLITKRHNTCYEEIFELYTGLIQFDSHMKQGKLGISVEEDLKVYYRLVFLRYFSESRSFG